MEEDILKEQNKQKRDLLLKEEKVRNYITADSDFQNLTILPSSIYSIERVVNMYMAVDRNSSAEISENILTGIFRYMVSDISNDLNGIVLHSDGTINEEASEKQEEQIQEAEKATAFYRDDDENDNVRAFVEIVDSFIDKKPEQVYREHEDDAPIIEPPRPSWRGRNGAEGAGVDEKSEEEPPTYSHEENVAGNKENVIAQQNKRNQKNEENKENITELPENADKIVDNAIEINEYIIDLVKYKDFNSEKFAKFPPEYQTAVLKSMAMELQYGNCTKAVLEAIRVIEPKYQEYSVSSICTDIYSNRLNINDNMLKIATGRCDEITELTETDLINANDINEVADIIYKKEELYFSSGRINFSKFKEVYGDNYVKAAIEESKKRSLEQLAFIAPDKFEEQKSTRIIGAYKHYLIQEAEKLDPSRKNDPEFWKTIVPQEGSLLQHMERLIKDNSNLLSEYMEDDLNIDLEEVAKVEEPKERYFTVLDEAENRYNKIEKEYPKIREDIFERMKNIESSENKEEEIAKIRTDIARLPKELYYLDFYANKDYMDYVEKYNSDLTRSIDGIYTKKYKTLQARKKEISENQIKKDIEKNKTEKTGEEKDTITDEEKDLLTQKINKRRLYSPRIKDATFNKNGKEPEVKGEISAGGPRMLKGIKTNREVINALRKNRLKQKEKNVAKVEKDITGATSLSKYMAKPKMIVDEIEIPVGGDTNSEKTSNTVETLLKEQGLVAKFKSVEEDLTVDEYASKMGEILTSINDKIKDGSLPKEINIDGSIKETTLKDIVSMSFENTEILLENLPNDISSMTKEEIEQAIKDHINEKIKEDKEKEEEIEPREDKENVTASKVNEEELSQEKLQEMLRMQQVNDRTQEIVEEEKSKKEIDKSIQEVKEEEKSELPVKDTFFNRVKRKIMDNAVVKKFTELFGGKKEDKESIDISESGESNVSKQVTEEKDQWGEIEDKEGAARKALEEHEANKQKEAEKVGVRVKDYDEQEK